MHNRLWLCTAVLPTFLVVAGCSHDENPKVSTGTIQDLETIPQDASEIIRTGAIPLPEADEDRSAGLEAYWFGPWDQSEPAACTPEEFAWAEASFRRRPTFGPNLLEVSAAKLEATISNALLEQYPSRADRAITVRNASLRALPSADPVFHDFRLAGEGYPFDYNQNSAVWAGTPLFVSHTSRDGRYVAADSPYTCGWIDVRDIAFVSDDFVAAYRAETLGAILSDRTPLESDQGGFLFEGRVGMLLPFEPAAGPETSVLAALADEDRQAVLTRAQAPSDVVAAVPMAFTGENLAGLVNQIIGQPYGWGGLGGYRDCSSTVLDLLLPFGLPLPRNSGQQAGAGKKVDLEEGLSASEKEDRVVAQAAPFRTLLNIPGHVMLYLGTYQGIPVAFHTIWGLRTESAGGSNPGRHVIGRSVITSLSPGVELESLSKSRGDLLGRIQSLTLVGEQPGR